MTVTSLRRVRMFVRRRGRCTRFNRAQLDQDALGLEKLMSSMAFSVEARTARNTREEYWPAN